MAARPLLGGDQASERAAQVRVAEKIAGVGEPSSGKVHGAGRRPDLAECVRAAGEREVAEKIQRRGPTQRVMQRESTFGQLEGGRHRLGEALRPETREHRQQCVRQGRRAGREDARERDQRVPVRAKPVDRRRARRHRVPVDGEHSPVVRGEAQGGELPAEGVHVGIEDALGERRRHRGVERVSSRGQHPKAGLGREVVLGHHHAAPAQ